MALIYISAEDTAKNLGLTYDEYMIIHRTNADIDFKNTMAQLKKDNIIEFNLRLSQFKSALAKSDSIPKCPTCGSTDIKKISGAKRWLTTGVFGLASSDVGKTMQCNSCGYKF